MVRTFFDESSTGRVLLLGGWVANCEEWDRFSEHWESALHAPPAIRHFSHHESKATAGQFEGWTTDQIEAKTLALTEIVCQQNMYGVISGLNLNTHAAAFRDSALSTRQLQSVLPVIHPYQWCFFSVIAAVLQVQLERGASEDTVDFVFDQQKGLFKKCAEFYREFRDHMPPDKKAIAGTVTEANDRDIPALQAADLLVGQATTSMRRSGKAELPWRKMATCLKIMSVPAYPPGFDTLPDLVSKLNIIWSTKRLDDITSR